jgi:hypothetical protein
MNDLLVYSIIEAAKKYWDYSDAASRDFCMQHTSGTSIVFGGVNRITWTARNGFQVHPNSCSPEFLENYYKIGPLPGK